MPLRDRAILVLQGPDSTAEFEFRDGFEQERTTTHQYLVGGRGQYLQEIWNQVEGFSGETQDELPNNRAGFHVDGGAGEKLRAVTFTTGKEPEADLLWGDGSGGTGPDNVTMTDASGPDVHQYDKADIFEYWTAQAKTDSVNPGFLYWNQWSDGTYADEAGVYGSPLPVVVREATVNTDLDKPTAVDGNIQLLQTLQSPEKVDDLTAEVEDALDEVLDFG